MPRGRGIYVDEPRQKPRSQHTDEERTDKDHYAPDEQALDDAQEPPD